MNHDPDRLDLLDTYEAPEPPGDLGDRFVARFSRLAPVRRRARWPYVAGGLALAAAAAIAIVALRSAPRTYAGTWSATARSTEKLGERGVAVVEPGGSITWDVAASVAHVRQDRGDVFYRVERATDVFEVATAQAVVRVRGTCFRVVLDAYGTTVAVYEGTVELANARGQILVTAGERAFATNGVPPRMMSGVALIAPPLATASATELLARDRAQRERIAVLEQQVATTARTAETMNSKRPRPIDLNHDQLADLAKQCMVPHEMMPTAGSTVMDEILEQGAHTVGLTAEERAAVARLIERLQPAYQEGLQRLYTELTGESGAALDPVALITELVSKSPAADTSIAFQKIAAERVAGAIRTTTDARSSVIERYLRFAMASADAFETQLAGEIGSDRARAFRRTWGMVNLAPRCPD